MLGTIFDIQRFALNDGPGIRTIVFFKGCPLRCIWCHNPESYDISPQLSYVKNKCQGCKLCVQACVHSVHTFENGEHKVDNKSCKLCGECISLCCHYAVSIFGESLTAEQLAEKILIDRPYYGQEGGVTFSGGEPMKQFPFVLQLAKKLKTENIHICMETSGFAAVDHFMEIAPFIDLFLFDYKATSDNDHKRFTGVSKEKISCAFESLYEAGCKIILRCPLIPGTNDSQQHLEGIAQMYKRFPELLGLEIMPYHNLGVSKAEQIGHSSNFERKTSNTEQKNAWIEKLNKLGCLNVKIG